ncbi:hypothetical protein VP01_1321g4 [Puccinia sorghi]|uniref:Uncharacterized protein n=1 Tax=Puccinia sorghi TaxID=27349 RepID=A0A0L6VN77_9BASI|nr:hypothetical protein VP01_1321g4 [Puccinia sorghi]
MGSYLRTATRVLGKHVEFEWELVWSMLHVNCMQPNCYLSKPTTEGGLTHKWKENLMSKGPGFVPRGLWDAPRWLDQQSLAGHSCWHIAKSHLAQPRLWADQNTLLPSTTSPHTM